jgi:hypothetical protein
MNCVHTFSDGVHTRFQMLKLYWRNLPNGYINIQRMRSFLQNIFCFTNENVTVSTIVTTCLVLSSKVDITFASSLCFQLKGPLSATLETDAMIVWKTLCWGFLKILLQLWSFSTTELQSYIRQTFHYAAAWHSQESDADVGDPMGLRI